MNLFELRQEAWDVAREVGTTDNERLWTTAEMNRYINRVYRFIARETRCIRDSVTPSICQITVTPVDWTTLNSGNGQDYIWATTVGDWLYHLNVAPYLFNLDARVLDIDEVKWTILPWRLTKVSSTKWQTNAYWEKVSGLPTEYATDLSNNKIALNYRATQADTLRLQVRRLPLSSLVNDSDTPEFRESYHDFFLNGVLSQMYSKQDSQTFDQVKTLDFSARYKADVDEIKQQESILDQRLKPNFSLDGFR
jgi:hypothetical protein